jgi:hypothetical protein
MSFDENRNNLNCNQAHDMITFRKRRNHATSKGTCQSRSPVLRPRKVYLKLFAWTSSSLNTRTQRSAQAASNQSQGWFNTKTDPGRPERLMQRK